MTKIDSDQNDLESSAQAGNHDITYMLQPQLYMKMVKMTLDPLQQERLNEIKKIHGMFV